MNEISLNDGKAMWSIRLCQGSGETELPDPELQKRARQQYLRISLIKADGSDGGGMSIAWPDGEQVIPGFVGGAAFMGDELKALICCNTFVRQTMSIDNFSLAANWWHPDPWDCPPHRWHRGCRIFWPSQEDVDRFCNACTAKCEELISQME